MPAITHKQYVSEMIYNDFVDSMHGSKFYAWTNPDIHWNSSVISHVLITASEIRTNQDPRVFYGGIEAFVGDALVGVSNIAVREGAVHFKVNVTWDSDLLIMVRMHIINMRIDQRQRSKKAAKPKLKKPAKKR